MFGCSSYFQPAMIYLLDKKTDLWASESLKFRSVVTLKNKISNLFSKYGSFVGKAPILILIAVILFTIVAYAGQTNLKVESPEMADILPEEIEVVKTTQIVLNEFGGFEKGMVLVEIDSQHPNSNEPRDIRDPVVINYINLLSKSISAVEGVSDVQSIADLVKKNDRIPKNIEKIKLLIDNSETASQLVDEKYRLSIVFFGLEEDIIKAVEEKVQQDVQSIIDVTPKPPGVKASITGNFAIYSELKQQTMGDMGKTSIVALIMVILVVMILFRSVKQGLIVLAVVGLGSYWTLGWIGLIGKSITPTSAAMLAMIIGIGDDFGIQVVNRYRQERKISECSKAIKTTIEKTITPILITTLAAVIGFRAMALGKITVAQDLADFVSLGVIFCMIAALTIVPALLILGDKRRSKK